MFDVKFVFLWTDAVLWLLVLGLIGYVVYVLRTEELARKWRKVLNNKTAVAAAAVLSVFFAAALAIVCTIAVLCPRRRCSRCRLGHQNRVAFGRIGG